MSRPPLDLTGRACSSDEFHLARQIVARSGLVEALSPYMDFEVGRHRRLSLEGFFVALQINALQRDHQAHLIEASTEYSTVSVRTTGAGSGSKTGMRTRLMPG